MTLPLAKLDLLLGYALAFALVAVVQATVVSLLAFGLLDLHVQGSHGAVVALAVGNAVLGMALGLFASAFARTEFQAVQFMPAFVFPQILLCGPLRRARADGRLAARDLGCVAADIRLRRALARDRGARPRRVVRVRPRGDDRAPRCSRSRSAPPPCAGAPPRLGTWRSRRRSGSRCSRRRTRADVGDGIAQVLAFLGVPDLISFAGGFPDPLTFPRERAASLLAEFAAAGEASPFQYAPTRGLAGTARRARRRASSRCRAAGRTTTSC